MRLPFTPPLMQAQSAKELELSADLEDERVRVDRPQSTLLANREGD